MISQDSRTFSENISILFSILNTQMEGIPEAQNKIQSLIQQISHSNKMWNTGIVTVGVPVIGWIAGGILLAMSNTKSKNIDFLLQELQERVDSRIILSCIVGIVKGILQNMLEAVNGAIDALEEMTAHWDSIDAQYTGLLKHNDDATNANRTLSLNIFQSEQ
ncbi:MAG: hypothetical protein QM671_19795 [Bacillus sp. (in: firmicutes)]|uniref:hypothetical protein n=1 Tax=Bacillus sp. TaxID=1409 RepID=UPI0039E29726